MRLHPGSPQGRVQLRWDKTSFEIEAQLRCARGSRASYAGINLYIKRDRIPSAHTSCAKGPQKIIGDTYTWASFYMPASLAILRS